MTKPMRLPLQYFAEDPKDDQGQQEPKGQPEPANYEERLKTDKELQAFVDRRINQAVSTAVANAETKWKRKHDSSLSEAERLATMTAEEKADYFQRKYESAEQARRQDENAREMERQAAAMFGEKQIPADLLSTINFKEATAEDVKKRVELLSGFEIYPKGTFETKLTEALNEKLKQKPPETHTGNPGNEDYSAQLNEARKNNDYTAIAYYTRLMAEQKKGL